MRLALTPARFTLVTLLAVSFAGWGREDLGPAGTVTDVAGSGAETVVIPPADARPAPAAARPNLPATAPHAARLVPAAGEFRGAWLHWRDYLTPAAIARTVQRAHRAGLNALLPLANYPDQAMWRGRLIPVNPAVAADFDPLRELVRQAHETGIQVHPYLCVLNGGLTKHPAFEPDWYARDPNGRLAGGWLNPAHPGVREFFAAVAAELAGTGVDGIHYDYIRHDDGADYDYSELTRRRFAAEQGFDPMVLRTGGGGDGMRLLATSFHTGQGAHLLQQQRQFLTNAGFRPPVTAESRLGLLPLKTVLVAGNLYSNRVSGQTIDELTSFAYNGGALIVLDGPEITTQSQKFAAAVGLAGKGYFDSRAARITLLQGPAAITSGVDREFRTVARGNACPKIGDARLLALFDDGTPAVTLKEYGRGHIVVFNFHVYQGEAATNPALVKLFANTVDWLAATHGIENHTRLVGQRTRPSSAVWDQWRVDQVTALVRQMSTAARAVRPDIVLSVAGGTRRSDVADVKRDVVSWLRSGLISFCCPMAYTTDNQRFTARLAAELAPVAEPQLQAMVFAGIGVYKAPTKTQRWIEQITLARRAGCHGVSLFAFEDLTDGLISELGNGPFRHPAPVPWRSEG